MTPETDYELINLMGPASKMNTFVFGRDGEVPTFNFPQLISVHSDGMEFGYGGSGPADSAVNVLIHFVDGKKALELHQAFKRDFIEKLPRSGGTITADQITKWIAEKIGL